MPETSAEPVSRCASLARTPRAGGNCAKSVSASAGTASARVASHRPSRSCTRDALTGVSLVGGQRRLRSPTRRLVHFSVSWPVRTETDDCHEWAVRKCVALEPGCAVPLRTRGHHDVVDRRTERGLDRLDGVERRPERKAAVVAADVALNGVLGAVSDGAERAAPLPVHATPTFRNAPTVHASRPGPGRHRRARGLRLPFRALALCAVRRNARPGLRASDIGGSCDHLAITRRPLAVPRGRGRGDVVTSRVAVEHHWSAAPRPTPRR